MLTRGPRNLPPRQQTLLAALDWSHALLDATERSVFRRLSVFAGSFSLEMARRVLSGSEPDDLDEWQVADAIGTLIDRSLLTVRGIETCRYAMLDTMRTYASSKLESADEASRFRKRHAHAFLDLFERVDQDHWHGRLTAGEAMGRLSDELDNALEALGFAIDHAPDVALALVPALSFGLRRRGGAETARILDATARCIHPGTSARLRATWLVEAARFWAGRKPREAAEWGTEAAALYRTLGDRLGLYRALIATTISDFTSVSELQRRSLDEAGKLSDSTWPVRPRLIGVWAQARVCRIDGRLVDALASLREVISLGKLDDDIALLAFARMAVAELELLMGRPEVAVDEAHQLAAWMRDAHAPAGLPATLRIVSAAELELGRTGPAREAARTGWSLARRFGDHAGWVEVLALLAAMENRGEDASLLIGACEEQASGRLAKRDPIAAAALVKAERLLQDAWASEPLQRWRQKGRHATHEQLASAAFSTPDTASSALPAAG